MADTPEGTDSIGDADDSQLRIRIPNPKVYMARQSQWKGRRGKPRCDHCRVNNLKCDRVLPTCNHCSWASGRECKYTPLPTPAHRGIPRCDRCRSKNLKCDRSLPICNNCTEDNETECNYTPKKRHKVPSDGAVAKESPVTSYGSKTASFLVSDVPSSKENSPDDDTADSTKAGHTFYGQNVASSSKGRSSKKRNRNGSSESDSPSTGPITSNMTFPSLAPKPSKGLSFISHSFPSDTTVILSKTHIEPWSNASFAPLPDTVIRGINTVNSIEMPNRVTFEESLVKFVAELIPDLRETSLFVPEDYAILSRSVLKGDFSSLSDRLQSWAAIHHLRCGSERQYLVLIPRDPFFHLDPTEEESLRRNYVARIDGKSRTSTLSVADDDINGPEWATAFERLPVSSQIFDLLVYAHRAHRPPSSMLLELRRIGIATITWPMMEIFVRLCPLCNLRSKPVITHSVKTEATQSFGTFGSTS